MPACSVALGPQRLATEKQRPCWERCSNRRKDDVAALAQLAGHMQEGEFATKIREIFLSDEMHQYLVVVRARYGDAEDRSEYEVILPLSPPRS